MKTKRVSKRSARPSSSKAKTGVVKPRASSRRKLVAAKPADTFTVRDLNRRPQDVLAAVDTLGSARVQSRSGKKYLIRPDLPEVEGGASRAMFRERLSALRAQMREAGEGFTQDGWETLSKAIAGE